MVLLGLPMEVGPNTWCALYGFLRLADTLKITPIGITNIPPPMSLCEATLEGTPLDIAISPSGTRIAALQHSGLDLVQWSFKPVVDPQVANKRIEVKGSQAFRQVCFADENTVCLLGDGRDGITILHCLSLGETGSVEQDNLQVPEVSSVCTFGSSEAGSLFLQGKAGNVIQYNVVDNSRHPVCKLPTMCPWMKVISVEGQVGFMLRVHCLSSDF